jgi:hypothetical protein
MSRHTCPECEGKCWVITEEDTETCQWRERPSHLYEEGSRQCVACGGYGWINQDAFDEWCQQERLEQERNSEPA